MANETTPATPTKSPLQSKTAWVMVIAFVVGFIPVAQDWIKNNPVTVFQALAAIGVLLRFFTSGKVKLFSDDDDTSGNTSSQGVSASGGNGNAGGSSGVSQFSPSRPRFLIWLVVAVGAVVSSFRWRTGVSALLMACAVLLVSCTQQQLDTFRSVPITLGVEGEHGTYAYSSKGGLVVTVKPKVREEKSAPAVDVEAILKREAEAGRFAEPVIPPGRSYRPRRMVLP